MQTKNHISISLCAVIIILFLFSTDGYCIIQQEQTQTGTVTGGSDVVSATFSPAATADRLLIAVCGANENVTLDAGPSGFTQIGTTVTGGPTQAAFYKVAAGGETTVSCDFSANIVGGIHIYEYSGLETVDVLDQNGEGTNTATTSHTFATLNTTIANELLFAALTYNDNALTQSFTNSFAEQNDFSDQSGPTKVALAGAHRIVSSIGSYTTTATSNKSADSAYHIFSFKAPEGIKKGAVMVVSFNTDAIFKHPSPNLRLH